MLFLVWGASAYLTGAGAAAGARAEGCPLSSARMRKIRQKNLRRPRKSGTVRFASAARRGGCRASTSLQSKGVSMVLHTIILGRRRGIGHRGKGSRRRGPAPGGWCRLHGRNGVRVRLRIRVVDLPHRCHLQTDNDIFICLLMRSVCVTKTHFSVTLW
jgi:hypothetical protein